MLNNAQNTLPGNIPLWHAAAPGCISGTVHPPALPCRTVGAMGAGARELQVVTPTVMPVFSPNIGCLHASPRRRERDPEGLCRCLLNVGGLAQPQSRSPVQEESRYDCTEAGAPRAGAEARLRGRRPPNLPSMFAADPHPFHQDKRKMRLISWGTTARRDRWQKHPATSRVYLSLAEKVRNQVGVLPAPRLHCRAAVPSTNSTASSMGKGWFSFQKLSGSAAPGCMSGCTAEPGLADARPGCGHLLGTLLPLRYAHPRQTRAHRCSSSPQMETSTQWPSPSPIRQWDVSGDGQRGCGCCSGTGCSSLGITNRRAGGRRAPMHWALQPGDAPLCHGLKTT